MTCLVHQTRGISPFDDLTKLIDSLSVPLILCPSPHKYAGTVKPPNKGHVGDNINSAVVSFVERLSSLRRFKMY